MKTLRIFLLFIFFLLHLKGFHSFSQAVFTPVPAPDGGWGGPIVGTQDPEGYMWFGSRNGLHRYDGYSYKSYFNDPLDHASLALSRIESLHADRKNNIWVGYYGAGLDRLDPETGIFTHFRHNPSDPTSISEDTITAILEDRDGKIWVGTEHAGLNCIDPKTATIVHFTHNPNDINSLSNNQVRELYEDGQGTIWIGTGFPFTGDLKWKEGGLNRFNPTDKNFTRFLHDPKDTSSLIDNRVRTIFEDSKGRFWVGTAGDGLHTMDRENGRFERHRYDPAKPNGLSRPALRKTRPWADDFIAFIREDVAGIIWIGTFSGGLNRYDPEARKITHYETLKEKSAAINPPTGFWWSYTSKDGALWISAYDGVYRLDPLRNQIPYYDVGTSVRSLLKDKAGQLWLGTPDGIVLYDTARINKYSFVNDKSDSASLSFNMVNSLFESADGNIWIGTDKGANYYDNQSRKFTRCLNENTIYHIYEDREGSVWFGTNSGLVLLNRQAGTFTRYQKNASDSTTLSHNSISYIAEDKTGYLWFGTFEDGLNRFDRSTKKFQHYLPGNSIISIFEDADAVLWIGTNRGLYYFNPSNNSLVLFTNPSAGLPGDIPVYHILEDDHQSLWVNTGIGLFRLGHDRVETSFFGRSHGMIPPGYATQTSCFVGNDGELFFGAYTGDGYYAFFPEQLRGNTLAPDLHITAFRLADQQVDYGDGSVLRKPLSQTKKISLSYDQNVFAFDFAGIHYSSPEDNRHLFKLENLDSDWREAGEEKTASYYNVPPGKYVFRVKAASSNGVWAEKDLTIIISSPWWRTGWAYSIYGLLLVAVIFVIQDTQKKRVIETERERTKERELAQAKEIEKAYHELKTTQAQLVQREKMASLGELTAGIAHEIQNPLNFVNNFSELNSELIDELKDERLKATSERNEQLEAEILNDISQNLEKITHHGKRADAIVKGMLLHSRISTKQKEPTDVNALADEYLRLAYHGLRAKEKSFNVITKTDFAETIPNISIVPQDIGRVILNLIINAFYAVTEKKKHRIDGYEPIVSVSTKKTGDKVLISVKDNGTGIPQKILDKIFQPFFTTKPTGQGTGLGLSLSYDIVKAHGGELKVETKEGEGSEFIFVLPIK